MVLRIHRDVTVGMRVDFDILTNNEILWLVHMPRDTIKQGFVNRVADTKVLKTELNYHTR